MQNKKKKPKNKDIEIEIPKKAAIVYSEVQREYFPSEALYITEKDAEQDARLIGEYLATLGITVALFPGNTELPDRLRSHKPELVINIADSVKGDESLASTIPGVLELLEIPYTGSGR